MVVVVQVVTRIVAFAILGILCLAPNYAARAETLAEVPSWLLGVWEGNIEHYSNARSARSLHVEQPDPGSESNAQWSVTGEKWSAAALSVSGETITVTTSAHSVVTLHRSSDTELKGTFRLKSGKTYEIFLVRTSSDADAGKFESGPGLPNQKCADGTSPDNVNRLFGAGLCLAAYTKMPLHPTSKTPVVVFLHADGGGRTSAAYLQRIARNLAEKLQVIGVSVLRPGYSDGTSKSEGRAHPEDDDYRRPVIDSIAGVLDSLRAYYPGHKIVLSGHSGGAAISALVMGIYPGRADAAVVVGCPCDVPRWRVWRNSTAFKTGTWSSLSPLSYVSGVDKSAPVIAVTGERDQNTLAEFARDYIDALRRNGVGRAEFMTAPGATHTKSIDAPTYHEAVKKVISLLNASKGE